MSTKVLLRGWGRETTGINYGDMIHKTMIVSLKLKIKLLWLAFNHALQFIRIRLFWYSPRMVCTEWSALERGCKKKYKTMKFCVCPQIWNFAFSSHCPTKMPKLHSAASWLIAPMREKSPLRVCFTEPKISSHLSNLLTTSAHFILIFNKPKQGKEALITYHPPAHWQILSPDKHPN